MLVILMAFIWT